MVAKGQSSLEGPLSECRGISADTEDPLYGCQWHLKNTGQFSISGKEITAGEDINIEGVWNEDVYGAGINVAVVSDGIDLSHEDLSDKVRSGPNYDHSDGSSFSGTRAAGVIAATGYNGLGVRGTAPGASIYSYRLSGDLREADAVVRNKEITAVSVNGRGSEDGAFFQEASASWEEGVELGISKGFYGKGVFYVRGAGDGHENNDQANFSEYSNYYGVTAVCSTDGFGKKSIFSEEGVNLWVCAPGSDIVTTDNNNEYVVTSGTFLSASQVGGVAALLREVNGNLSWRDIKLILAGSARQNDFFDMSWETGAVKYGSDVERYKYNPKYGFGVVDAEAAAELARSWKGVGEMRTVTAFSDNEITIPDGEGEADEVLTSRLIIPDLEETTFTEFVEVELVLSCDCLQDLNINITSPSGTVSELVRESVRELSDEDEKNCVSYLRRTHRFGSAKHLGEDPSGEWVLKISDTASGDEEDGKNTVTLHSWSIKVYGNFYQGPGSEISPKHHDISFGDQTIDDQVYRTGVRITPLSLPAIATGSGLISYGIQPGLPRGLQISGSIGNQTVEGTPTTAKQETAYRWIALKQGVGDSDEITFNITVEANTDPTFSGATVPEQIWTEGVRIPTLRFPNATGGNGTLTYFLSPAQPVGISRQDNRLFGTPTEPQRRSLYTWTVRDEDNDEDIIEFYITVRDKDDVPSFGSETVEDQSYVNGSSVTLTLPAATGKDTPLTYSLTNSGSSQLILLRGLEFNANTRKITGTLDEDLAGFLFRRHTYTYTVTDSEGDTDTLEFNITVTRKPPLTFGGQTIPDQRYANQKSIINPVTLPEATGGAAPLTYSITPVLQYELNFNSSTRQITGTPNVSRLGNTDHTYTVTDNQGDTAEITFGITVELTDRITSFRAGEKISDKFYFTDVPITPVTLPRATNGNSPIKYSLSPSLPTGLSFNANTRKISGTPTAASSNTEYTYRASDLDGDRADLKFRITVTNEADTEPSFGSESIDNKVYVINTSVNEALPLATGGNGTLTYDIVNRQELPDGLGFRIRNNTPEIFGIPTTVTSETMYTYRVTDADGDSDERTFSIMVRDATDVPTFSGETIDDQEYTAGSQITPVTLPEATSGDAPLIYRLTPALPDGLIYNNITGVISGTPTAAMSETMYTYTVTDNDGDTDKLTFNIEVAASFSNVTIEDKVYIVGTAVTEMLPEATGHNGTVTYSLTPSLPTGLDFNTATREISGTPAAATSQTAYTYTVTTGAGGPARTLTFRITIEEDSMPEFSSTTIPDRVYTGRTITLPEATGGNPPVTYNITPDLPAGLRFNEVTRVISGTPRSTSTDTYTYTVTDGNGDTDEVSFMLSVEVASAPPPNPRPRPAPDTEAGGGGCAVSDQSSVDEDILGVMACLILIPVSVVIRRKRRAQIKT